MSLPSLPILTDQPAPEAAGPGRPWRAAVLILLRIGLVAAVAGIIHHADRQRTARQAQQPAVTPPLEIVRELFPAASALSATEGGAFEVSDADEGRLGAVVQTSPQSDRIVGFSGPTNVLLGFDPQDRITGVRILWSRDTREHVAQVVADGRFLPAYTGLTRASAAAGPPTDAVTGATLTSLAIAEAITHRLGGVERSLRFPESLAVDDVQPLFVTAAAVVPDPDVVALWRVRDQQGKAIGRVLRTSPAADNIVGYQGPTEALIGLTPRDDASTGAPDEASVRDLVVTGVRVGRSYDNEPYVGYVRDDRYFFRTFHGLTLAELAAFDLRAEGVEGVSGATMSSMAIAEGLTAAARRTVEDLARVDQRSEAKRRDWSVRDVGTSLVTVIGVVLGLSSLRGRRWLRLVWLVLLVGYLGFLNGDLVSQALLVGWVQHGVPWRTMPGPLLLTAAALCLPIVTRRNVYCSHLCPHGAAQQLLKGWLPWRLSIGSRWRRRLSAIPGLLLLWVVLVASGGWAFSLVDIEPFDAYVPTIAGWATLTIFTAGLLASLLLPMAYCQYGCPTGALLNYLRRHGRHDRLGLRDALAAVCLIAALVLGLR